MMMKKKFASSVMLGKKKTLSFFIFLIVFAMNFAMAAENTAMKKNAFGKRKEVQQFITEMHKKHDCNQHELTQLFNQFERNEKVLELISKQYEAQPWFRYQARLVTEERAKAGARFLKEHQPALIKAEKEFGVPKEIIVAILGVETNYGQNTGSFYIIEALSTLAFDYPRRADFFRKELEHFLLLAKEGALNPREAKGSFAGAMGIPQFMPSSYRQYAIDFSGTGKRDLLHDRHDVIGSVANYFKSHGWKPGESIVHKAKASGSQYLKLGKSKEQKPNITIGELAQYQVTVQNPKLLNNKNQKVKFILLETQNGSKEPWMGLHNFYVITRYNHSIHYAMAVYQLSQHIKSLQ